MLPNYELKLHRRVAYTHRRDSTKRIKSRDSYKKHSRELAFLLTSWTVTSTRVQLLWWCVRDTNLHLLIVSHSWQGNNTSFFAGAITPLPFRPRLGLHQWPVASLFLVPQQDETGNDRDPIHIVRYDGSISGRILPPENCIEYSPPSATIDIRATALFFFLVWLRTWDRSLTCAAVLTFTCQTLLRISYEPGPTPVSAASPPIILFHCCNVKTVYVFHRESRIIPYPSQTALRSWRRDRLQRDTRNMLKWLRKVGWMWRFHLYHLVNISMLAYKNGLSYL